MKYYHSGVDGHEIKVTDERDEEIADLKCELAEAKRKLRQERGSVKYWKSLWEWEVKPAGPGRMEYLSEGKRIKMSKAFPGRYGNDESRVPWQAKRGPRYGNKRSMMSRLKKKKRKIERKGSKEETRKERKENE